MLAETLQERTGIFFCSKVLLTLTACLADSN